MEASLQNTLTDQDRKLLLKQARTAIEFAVGGLPLPEISLEGLSTKLREKGASFVTLTINGELRGCVGTLEPYQSLIEDVREHAVAAALQDYRFPPVAREEVGNLHIEISRLTPPTELEYDGAEDLLSKLRPNIDGVTLFDGWRRATFLPQVWEKLPDKIQFLEHLCEKMGVSKDTWRKRKMRVQVYQVEEFHE